MEEGHVKFKAFMEPLLQVYILRIIELSFFMC